MSWIDLIILGIIAWNLLLGVKRGLIVSIFNLIGFILAAYITKVVYPTVATVISNSPKVVELVDKFVAKRVDKTIENNAATTMDSAFDVFKLPGIIKDSLVQSTQFQEGTNALINDFNIAITNMFVNILINVISIIIVFIIARVLISFIVRILDGIAELPLLRQVNKIAGLAFGAVAGILMVYFMFVLLTPTISISPEGAIGRATFSSVLGNYFYSNNIILYYLKVFGIF